jgi:elongation factor G
MRGHSAITVVALLVEAVHAYAGNGVVQWDIQRTQRRQELNRLRKRDSTVEEVVTNEQARGGYFATCKLGTPGQHLTLQLDTGSSDIWVPDSDAAVCRQTQSNSEGCALGTCMASLNSPCIWYLLIMVISQPR